MRLIFKFVLMVMIPGMNLFSSVGLIRDVVVIVGNCRTAGLVLPHVGDVVGQSTADFSHRMSFPGERVVSVDVAPLDLVNKDRFEHVIGDFRDTKSFALNSQRTIMLEWFPAYNPEDVKEVVMVKALRKAFTLLKPGANLIIDHNPYFCFSPNTKETEHLQATHPFALFLTPKELHRMKAYLRLAAGGATILEGDSAVGLSLTTTSTIFPKTESLAAYIYGLVKDSKDGEMLKRMFMDPKGHMFIWAYHSFSRANLMMETLREIGFDTRGAKPKFARVSPYTKRKWSWLIEATKPN
jgi:hypothetical protein